MRLRHSKPNKETPTCPNCGAKFSHDSRAMACRSCGLPDEAILKGKTAIREFQRQQLREQGLTRSEMKVAAKTTGARKSRTKYKHGRTTRVRA